MLASRDERAQSKFLLDGGEDQGDHDDDGRVCDEAYEPSLLMSACTRMDTG